MEGPLLSFDRLKKPCTNSALFNSILNWPIRQRQIKTFLKSCEEELKKWILKAHHLASCSALTIQVHTDNLDCGPCSWLLPKPWWPPNSPEVRGHPQLGSLNFFHAIRQLIFSRSYSKMHTWPCSWLLPKPWWPSSSPRSTWRVRWGHQILPFTFTLGCRHFFRF